MTRRLGILLFALGLLTAAPLPNDAHAQSLITSRAARYNGFGQGYYGGYGRGYNGSFSDNYNYSGYGNGPYGFGLGTTVQYPANARYVYGRRTYYSGYGYSENPGQYYVPAYSPYGFTGYDSFGNRW